MATTLDHYTVLGITPTATPDDIRKAYRQAARASHPDLHPGDATAAARFRRVQQAYEVLGDPARRAAYDAPMVRQAGRPASYPPRASTVGSDQVDLVYEVRETIKTIKVVARKSGLNRRFRQLIRYLERL